MGYFTPTQRWGFPHKVKEIVRSFENGTTTLADALEKLGENYVVSMRTMFTYENGQKKEINSIEFGCPVVVRFVM